MLSRSREMGCLKRQGTRLMFLSQAQAMILGVLSAYNILLRLCLQATYRLSPLHRTDPHCQDLQTQFVLPVDSLHQRRNRIQYQHGT